MGAFYRCIRSDIYKMKRQPILWVHLLVPLAGVGVFLAYYTFTSWTPVSKVGGYLEVMAVAFPTLIGIVCSMAAEQESSAGNFQPLLTFPVKLLPFASSLLVLVVLGAGAAVLAAGGFGLGFTIFLNETPFALEFYFYAACILAGSSIFLYALHWIVSLQYGGGASIGIGIVESLLSALMLTGLGNGIWQFFPCAWGVRFISIYELLNLNPKVVPDLSVGVAFCAAATAAILFLACLWFYRWEGRKIEE